jgi:hypothetical protein
LTILSCTCLSKFEYRCNFSENYTYELKYLVLINNKLITRIAAISVRMKKEPLGDDYMDEERVDTEDAAWYADEVAEDEVAEDGVAKNEAAEDEVAKKEVAEDEVAEERVDTEDSF